MLCTCSWIIFMYYLLFICRRISYAFVFNNKWSRNHKIYSASNHVLLLTNAFYIRFTSDRKKQTTFYFICCFKYFKTTFYFITFFCLYLLVYMTLINIASVLFRTVKSFFYCIDELLKLTYTIVLN